MRCSVRIQVRMQVHRFFNLGRRRSPTIFLLHFTPRLLHKSMTYNFKDCYQSINTLAGRDDVYIELEVVAIFLMNLRPHMNILLVIE